MSQILALAGLGKKTIVFPDKKGDHGKLRAKLEEEFPKLPEISVSPGDRRKSPSSRPWRAGYSDPNKKIFILEDGKIHCVNFSLQAR